LSFENFQIADKQFPDPRMGGMGQRHSISDYEQLRPQSGSNLQSFYANQRHQPRPNEAEQMLQAKRRMAAQRERELRNYHQEQQYNRSEFLYPSSRIHLTNEQVPPQTFLHKGNPTARSAPIQ
jgi:hypothetical protein